jgi:hypothetical protein
MKRGNGLSRGAVVKSTLAALAGGAGPAEARRNASALACGRLRSPSRDAGVRLAQGPESRGIVEERPEPGVFTTPEHEATMVGNVRRGMGPAAVRLDPPGVEKPLMQGPVESARVCASNPEPPVTRGIQPFNMGIGEVFDAAMKPGRHTQPFRSSQEQAKRNAIGGRRREEGSGRAAAPLRGHTTGTYGGRQFADIMRSSAHGTPRLEIPPAPADIITARG